MTLMKPHHQHQLPSPLLDGLYCEEDGFFDAAAAAEQQVPDGGGEYGVVLEPQDLLWEEDELVSLISKQRAAASKSGGGGGGGDTDVLQLRCSTDCRREAVDWLLRVKAHYGFTALTCVLAVNYFDRFVSGFDFKEDKPWMGQLAAVACLSLAAKVEETQVPLLLDLQVEDSKYVFEPKTLKKMELLVLSTLQWRMNPVTPISFFDHIIRRLGMNNHLHREFLWRCESLLLCVIADSRFMSFLPSIVAAATMLHVTKEVEACNEEEYRNQLMSVLKVSEDDVIECYELIAELAGWRERSHKRKRPSTQPGSPSGVVDAAFSSDSSNNSWEFASSSSPSSPRHMYKRSRTWDQQMRLPKQNRTFADPISSPH
ncbi:CYCD3-2 [Linum grandiflorum]